MQQTVGYIRDINTLKIIGTIGSRNSSHKGWGTDNLHALPELDQKISIQGSPMVVDVHPDNKQPTLSSPEPREFRVVAVTRNGCYVKKWKNAPERTWKQLIGLEA